MPTPVGPIGVVISWEVFFSSRARDAIGNGGEVLTNPTNGSSYWLTQVQSQQVASSKLRALETGRWMLQAAPTGFSAIVDPDGRLVDCRMTHRDVVPTPTADHRRPDLPQRRLRGGRARADDLAPHRRHLVDDPRPVADHASLGAGAGRRLGVDPAPPLPRPLTGPTAASAPDRRYTSTRSVTGPSFTSDTAMSAPKRPVATVAPSARSASTTACTSGSACSGRAAAIHDGRRPLRVSP